ncbi:helix-turn-helix domain-containing protein [Rudanella paleaurantiibacter]|uniref:helix-turn-helix domain-containing protein n=1 Tax=Rudanella paleaurantiibacter TaxID=2614655 RepID=UPI001FE74F03|nr:helix-turn-helix domain-containing protein [Rudanella paleaurantiibacter]
MEIRTEQDYQALMSRIEGFLQKATEGGGFTALSPEEGDELHRLSLLAEAYEDSIPIMPLPVPPPKNLVDILEHKMYEQRMKQRDLARLLNVSEARLSDVLSGKRKPNLDLAKRIHLRLGVDAETVLRLA